MAGGSDVVATRWKLDSRNQFVMFQLSAGRVSPCLYTNAPDARLDSGAGREPGRV